LKKFLKSIAVMSLSLLLFNICIQPMSAKAADDELSEAAVAAPSAILVERTSGTVLYEKNAHEKLKPASVTKIMSMLLIMEAIEDGSLTVEDKVTASEHASSMGGSQIYLEPGEQMTVHDMLKSIAVSSANDACVAMAEHVAGSEESWADILELHAIQDQRSLHVNRYDSYTLDWRWPFESGDDAYDTWLGNQAAKSGVTMTLVIKTTAIMDQKAMEQDAMGENGIWQGGVPQTGDNSRIVLYMLLGGSSFLVLLALWCLIARKKKDYQEESHEEDNKGYQYRRKPGEKRE